jgi:ribonuclease PH
MGRRQTKITRDFLIHPQGSVLIESGRTKVICTVSYEESIPQFLLDKDPPEGWLTAEYSMIPGATTTRFRRERNKTNSRSLEIQRLIGRTLRAVVDNTKFPGFTLYVDCDVIQADGGTRTAAITGACVAVHDTFRKMINEGLIQQNPMQELVAAISVGIVKNKIVLDLNYEMDSQAEVDMNIVMTESGRFVEVQGTAEKKAFTYNQLNEMLLKAELGIKGLIKIQKKALAE